VFSFLEREKESRSGSGAYRKSDFSFEEWGKGNEKQGAVPGMDIDQCRLEPKEMCEQGEGDKIA
jgi:hypothetical protein